MSDENTPGDHEDHEHMENGHEAPHTALVVPTVLELPPAGEKPGDPPPARPAAPVAASGMGGGTALVLSLLVSAGLGGGLFYVVTNPPEPPGIVALQSNFKSLQGSQKKLREALAQDGARIAALEVSSKASSDNAGQPAASLGPVNDQIAALTARVEKLESRGDQGSIATPVAGASSEEIAALSSKLDNRLAAAKQDQVNSLTQLSARLDKLEAGTGNTGEMAKRAVLLARLQLAAVALETGQALGTIEDAPPALAQYAQKPPPTDVALRNAFPAMMQAASSASRPELAYTSIYQRSLARLQQAITVRKGDEVLVGDPAAGVLARAQDAVARDDWAAALAAVDQLQGSAAAAAKDWADQVRDLLAARAALNDLMAHS